MDLVRDILDLFLPDQCVLCEQLLAAQTTSLLCSHCWRSLPFNAMACPGCALPSGNGMPGEPVPGHNSYCAQCRHQGRTSEYTIAPLLHEQSARFLIHRLKFHHGLREGMVLAHALAAASRQAYGANLPVWLIPVPLSWRNQALRGFNQAAWLAHCVSRQLGVRVVSSLLRRSHGPAQRTLTKAARLQLPAHTFRLVHKRPLLQQLAPDSKQISTVEKMPRHVAVIDDVLTTGRTTEVVRQLLYRYGASRVDIWAASRAVA